MATSKTPRIAEQNEAQQQKRAPSPTTAEQLKTYRDILRKAIDSNSPSVIPNSGKEHASEMMAALFDASSTEVLMTVGRFSGEVSNENVYLQALERALERDVKFRVVMLEIPNEVESAALQLLMKRRESHPHQVELFVGTDDTSVLFQKNSVHFSVFDGKHYRLEINPVEFAAIGGICQPTQSASLARAHSSYVHLAQAYRK